MKQKRLAAVENLPRLVAIQDRAADGIDHAVAGSADTVENE